MITGETLSAASVVSWAAFAAPSESSAPSAAFPSSCPCVTLAHTGSCQPPGTVPVYSLSHLLWYPRRFRGSHGFQASRPAQGRATATARSRVTPVMTTIFLEEDAWTIIPSLLPWRHEKCSCNVHCFYKNRRSGLPALSPRRIYPCPCFPDIGRCWPPYAHLPGRY